ncbi:DsbA family protein [Sediminivirga luteola]|uniref:DsbA family protein n=1 Tax=Sediminivirga luteola TaxID=1774748 RepID=UPI001F5736DC|nr:thioredoxin domain-containing protein [Sediminivirga luteola]MCI2266892.1 thioredoxin domain-containing protein [Sediminivirga luteola]
MADVRTGRTWLFPVIVAAVVIALVVVVLSLQRGSGDGSGQAESAEAAEAGGEDSAPVEVVDPGEQADLSDVEGRDPADPLAVGPEDAPVVLVVFSDYQCPFCAQWSHDTLPLMLEHVEAGDLRIEWRDVNVFGEASTQAARGAYAAALQDGFLEYHEALFPEGETRDAGELTEEGLIGIAGEVGLDAEQFASDMASSSTAEAVAKNEKLGLDLGAFSTPSFILGGAPIVGAQPSQVFTDAFDTALAESAG